MANDPILHLLGLAKKAGRLEVGEEPVGALCGPGRPSWCCWPLTPPLTPAEGPPISARRATCSGWPSPFPKRNWGWRWAARPVPWSPWQIRALPPPSWRSWPPAIRKNTAPPPSRSGRRPDRALQRQREKRQHEKNLREGKRKPWAPPPKREEAPPAPARKKAGPKAPQEGSGPRLAKTGGRRTDHTRQDRPRRPAPVW